jgi:hypothetical protein
MPGSHVSRCSAVPCLTRIEPTIAGETTMSRSEQPAPLISSATAASALIPIPPPPNSSGRLMPRKPREASASHSSVGGTPASLHRRMYAGPKSPAIEATVSRMRSSSSLGTSGRTGAAMVLMAQV